MRLMLMFQFQCNPIQFCRKFLKSSNCKFSIFCFLYNLGVFLFPHPLVASQRCKNVYLRSDFVYKWRHFTVNSLCFSLNRSNGRYCVSKTRLIPSSLFETQQLPFLLILIYSFDSFYLKCNKAAYCSSNLRLCFIRRPSKFLKSSNCIF